MASAEDKDTTLLLVPFASNKSDDSQVNPDPYYPSNPFSQWSLSSTVSPPTSPLFPISPVSPPTSPVSPIASCDFDPGSHYALQKAYLDLKRRLKESNSQNDSLIRKVKWLQSAAVNRGSSSGVRMDEGVGSGEEESMGLQQAAEEGFANNLQRQLVRARAQLQAVEMKYQEKVRENDNNLAVMRHQLNTTLAQVALLNEEKVTLQEKYLEEKEEKERAEQTVVELKEQCENLKLEKEKVIKEEALLHLSLRKAHQELAILKEKQGETMQGENSSELAAEVAYMRSVIKNLKDMVLDQRKRLGNCGKALSMTHNPRSLQSSMTGRSSLHDPSSVESNLPMSTGHSSGSPHSAQSWEMVNAVTHPPSLNPRQQQQQQQQQQLLAMQQRCVTSSSSSVNPYWASNNLTTSSNGMEPPRVKWGLTPMPTPVRASNGLGPGSKQWGSQSAVVQRCQPTHNVSLPPKSRTEVLRSATATTTTTTTTPRANSKSPDLDGSYPQQQLLEVGGERGMGPPPPPPAPRQPLKHLGGAGGMESGHGMNSQPRFRSAVGVPNSVAVYPPQFQKQPSKLHHDSNNSSNSATTAPSMHILNPSVMAGARVIRNELDSFGSSGGMMMMGPSPMLPGLSSPSGLLNKPWSAHLPQEHDDGMQFNTAAAMSELSPLDESNFANTPRMMMRNQVGAGLDRQCPVCCQDFTHISMEEFQSHVFECFDKAEENSIAPETLQPQTAPAPSPSLPPPPEAQTMERVCPMCVKLFPADVSQQYFEGHVQSHFNEAAAEQFEFLDKES